MSDAILDAARDVFEEFGLRRANVDDVARAAGVSRSTLYRAYPNKDTLLAAVLDRETREFFDQLEVMASGLAPQEAVIECFVSGMSIMRDIPVLGRLAQTEPEAVYGLAGAGHAMLVHAPRLAASLRRAGARMPEADLLMAAEVLLRLAGTFLLDPVGHLDVTDEHALRDFAKRFLSGLVA